MSGHYKIEVTRGKARLFLSSFGWGMRANATCYDDRETAEGYARDVGGIVKRWLTPAEAKRKAQAAALRDLAKRINKERKKYPTQGPDSAERYINCALAGALMWSAGEAEERADAIWPRAKKGGA